MANYSVLKAAVQAVVKTNGNQEITGANMQSTLISIINSLGTGYQFMGVATPSTSPGTPDYNVAYIGGAGTYANFGTSVTVPVGSIGVFKYNGSWTSEILSDGLYTEVNKLEEEVFDKREYGTLSKYISQVNGQWTYTATSLSKYIKVKQGDIIHIVKNNERGAYAAFITSVDTSVSPVFANGTSSVIINITDSEFVVNEDCYFWWIYKYDDTQYFQPSVLTLNGVNILENTYERSVISDIKDDVEQLREDVYEEIDKLDAEVFDIRSYGSLGYYITRENAWGGTSQTISNYISVKAGDVIHIVKNNVKNSYVTFLASVNTSVAPVFANYYGGVIDNITDSTLQVTEDCYFWWMLQYTNAAEENYRPSVLTLNGEDIRTNTYAGSKISELYDSIDDLQEQLSPLEGLSLSFSKMVGSYSGGFAAIDWGNTVTNKYWNLVNGSAGLVTAQDYVARTLLYPVNAGQLLRVTAKTILSDPAAAAYAIYDNDGLPPNGVSSRRNWNSAIENINNGDGTHTYTFQIEQNGTQLGIFFKSEPITFYIALPEEYNYTEALDQHIEYIAGGGQTTAADSAKYYLKGGAPKTFTKKIALLAAGQSNIDGRVPNSEMPSYIQSAMPIQNCLYVHNSQTGAFAPLNITGNWGFDLVTYYYVSQNISSQNMYVMKWSEGGTSIDPLGDGTNHWTADYEELASLSNSLLYKFETEIRNHVASTGSEFDIRAFLWHQGEGDRAALGTGTADRYYVNLRNMISYVRGVVGNERLPIITGSISQNSSQYDTKVHDAQVRLASEDPYFTLIDMSGAPLLDSYHFNAASSIYLGEMAFNALIDYGIVSATKLTPTRPW